MKLLHVIETLGHGGAEQSLVNLLPVVSSFGVGCEVAVLWGNTDLAEDLMSRGVEVHFLELKHRWSVLEARRKLTEIINKREITIVHAHLFFPRIYTALLKQKAPNVKTVASFHNQSFIGFPPNTLWRKIRLRIDRYLTNRNFDLFFAVTNSVGEHYREFLHIGHYHIMPNAFPDMRDICSETSVRNEIFNKYAKNKDSKLLVSPGRLITQKGHDILIRAIPDVINAGISVNLIISGKGGQENTLRRIVEELHLTDSVEIVPPFEHEKLLCLMKVADLVVMPSRFEGFGLVAAEAMGVGSALIASGVGGLKEVVVHNKTGVLVEPENVAVLADRIVDLLKDGRLREELGRQGEEYVHNTFNVEVVAKNYISALDKLYS